MARVVMVAGLSWGDEGKGAAVDWLCRRGDGPKTVVRYNGGAQAGHNVVTSDGRHHTFSQFGAGTFAGARTFLSRHMIVNPLSFEPEARHLEERIASNPHALVTVDREALVTTPYHIAVNRLRELLRGDGRHGSCGMGVGETVATARILGKYALRVGDLEETSLAERKLDLLLALINCQVDELRKEYQDAIKSRSIELAVNKICRPLRGYIAETESLRAFVSKVQVVDGREHLRGLLRSPGHLVFEGAQGVLLDERHGFHPHTTWSDCTFGNADRMLDEVDGPERTRVGCLRAYHTRHGAGPFPTERRDWRPAGDHNAEHEWQGAFRVGHLDGDLVRYAVDALRGLDEVHVSCLDAMDVGGVRISSPRVDRSMFYVAGEALSEASALLAQERMGEYLARTPVDYGPPLSVAEHVARISELCRAPVTVVGRGPRAEDRHTSKET